MIIQYILALFSRKSKDFYPSGQAAVVRAGQRRRMRYDNHVQSGTGTEAESDGIFPLCGKPTNFSAVSR